MASHARKKQAHSFSWRRLRAQNQPLRVLVVDDNSEAAEALATYLMLENMQCRMAFGGSEAVTLAMQWLPDLIVMDVSMPDINGIQAALMLRKHSNTKHITIIAFTALDEAEVKRHMEDHEFDAYCQKGTSPTMLVSLINTHIRFVVP